MKTAVEFLVEHFESYGFDLSLYQNEIQQAKEMNVKFLEESFHCGCVYRGREGDTNFKEFYNETFKNKI